LIIEKFQSSKPWVLKNPTAFLFFLDKEPLNVFKTFYIESFHQRPASPGMPMDNAGAPRGAVSTNFVLLSLS